jgi:hypothetical protein
MKSSLLKPPVILIIFTLLTGVLSLNAQIVMTFQVDLRGFEMEPGTEVGIRGEMPPLSWDKSYPMDDPDKDSIYTVKIIFNEGEAGDRVMYKYMVGDTWDNDRFGPYGNRVAALSNCPQVLPVDKWDVIESFALELLLQDASESEIYPWIYLISNGKTNGLTPKEVVIRYSKFWGGDHSWLQKPETLMIMEEFNQGKYTHGYFEIIENTPEKVVYKIKNNWAEFIQIRGENGNIMGVTGEDITAVSKTWLEYMAKEKGWSFDWQDDGLFAVITIGVE